MGAWQQIAALPKKLEGAAAVYHTGLDKVYVFGGAEQVTGYNTTTYIYTPDTNTWTTGAPQPAGFGKGGKAFVAPDDKIHFLNVDGAHYRYDPVANTWDTRAPNPSPGRERALGFQDASGRIILAGSRTIGGSYPPSYIVERYDSTTNTWTTLTAATLTQEQFATTGVLGDDGKLYTGYQTFVRNLVAYDPTAGTWAYTPNFQLDTSWTSGGYNVAVSRLPNGLILRLPMNEGSTRTRRIDGFNPATNTWTLGVIPDFPGQVYDYFAVATDPTGRIWVLGGEDNSGALPSTDNSIATSYVYLQNRAPIAPTLRTLVNDALVSTGSTNRASHTFNDPDTGDSQSKADHRWRLVGDVTWTTQTLANPNTYIDFPAGTFTPGNWERQVLTYDAAGAPGPWSTSGFFTAADPPAGPSITYPINGQTLEQNETLVWSASDQDSYQVRRVADLAGAPDVGTVYFDTGEVVSTLIRSLGLTFATNNRDEHIQVRVKFGGLWSPWVSVMGSVDYTEPPTPTFVIYKDPSTASLLVMLTNPVSTGLQPPTSYNDVYVTENGVEVRKATEQPTNSSWRYWTPLSGHDYSTAVRVVAVGDNGTTASSS